MMLAAGQILDLSGAANMVQREVAGYSPNLALIAVTIGVVSLGLRLLYMVVRDTHKLNAAEREAAYSTPAGRFNGHGTGKIRKPLFWRFGRRPVYGHQMDYEMAEARYGGRGSAYQDALNDLRRQREYHNHRNPNNKVNIHTGKPLRRPQQRRRSYGGGYRGGYGGGYRNRWGDD